MKLWIFSTFKWLSLKQFFKIRLIILMIQTSYKSEKHHDQNRPIKFALPANLQDKYHQIPQFQSIIRATEHCPFPEIRELIIAFHRTDTSNNDIPLCDILRSKYSQFPELNDLETKLSVATREVEQTCIRSNKLMSCLESYIHLYNNLINEISQPSTPNSTLTARKYQKNTTELKTTFLHDYQFCALKNQHQTFMSFSSQLEGAITQVMVTRTNKLDPKAGMGKVDNVRQFIDIWGSMRTVLLALQIKFATALFKWREAVKEGKITEGVKQLVYQLLRQWKQKMEHISMAYNEMLQFGKWAESDRRELSDLNAKKSADYTRFMPGFIRFSETEHIQLQSNIYHDAINQEKQLLDAHLRKNYGLVVPYNPSESYKAIIAPIQKSGQSHLSRLLSEQMNPLEDGMLYLNGQYQNLYKKACQSKDPKRCRTEIQNWIFKFTSYSLVQSNRFANHLLESCQRLLRIVK